MWTVARLVWGFVALTTVLQGWLANAHKTKELYSAVLVLIFLVTELVPFIMSLDESLLTVLGKLTW